MKYYKTILFLNFIITVLLSQQDTLNFGDIQSVVPNPYSEGTDTDWPDQKGYVAGTNVYRDIGKYQRFEFYNSKLKQESIRLVFQTSSKLIIVSIFCN